MTTVTLGEAREALPDLLRRVAAGEQIVLADGDNWLGLLAPPPPKPPTAEELAADQARLEAIVREWTSAALGAGTLPAELSVERLIAAQRGPDE
ncbi:MAG: hypothetical protein K2X82_27380 [Gemmataceae bacterium]|nr:hypothetical protein [Gemmataceae bacterium]